MSHPVIHLITERARKRLGRTYQVDALAGARPLHDVNPHRDFPARVMHGYYGSAALRYGYDPPALRAIREAALAQGVDVDALAQLTLDQVIVLPDGSLTTSVGGIVVTTNLRTNVAAPWPKANAQYERTGQTDVATMTAVATGGEGSQSWSGLNIPGPVVLLSFTLTGSTAIDTNESVSVDILPIGRVFNSVLAPSNQQFSAAGGGQLGRWVTSGTVVGVITYNFVAAVPRNLALTLLVSYEHLRQTG